MRVPIRKPGKYTHAKSDLHITKRKFDELTDELAKLKKFAQPQTSKEVMRLAEDGDFSENAAYQMAKGRLRSINQRILELEDQVGHAEIITSSETDRVQLGNTVTIVIDGEKRTYRILGSLETDPANGIISYNSPMGAALMGRTVGDTVKMRSAHKEVECRIVKIE